MLSKTSESLTLQYDGNVVHMRDTWFSVKKLMNQLKLLEFL